MSAARRTPPSLTPAQARIAAARMGPLWSLLFRIAPPSWSEYVLRHWSGKKFVIAIPYIWLLLFFAVPFLIVFKISFSEKMIAQPPYAPLYQWVDDIALQVMINLDNYKFVLNEELYVSAYGYSLMVAAISALLCLLIGYPMAYSIARCQPTTRNVLLLLVMLPSFTSFLLRVYAWIGLLKSNGLINNVLLGMGVIDEPLAMMQTDFAVYLGIVYSYLPFMILPLYSNLEKHDPTLLEAAADLGARPFTTFWRVTWPQSYSGIAAGLLLVFIPVVGEYVIPSLLGRTDQLMIGSLLADEFFKNADWPKASAVAITMLMLLIVPIMIFQRFQAREMEKRK